MLARPVLDSLDIDPFPTDMGSSGETLLVWVSLIQADTAKLQQMDFSPPRLAEVAPPDGWSTWVRFDREIDSDSGLIYSVHFRP